MTSESALLTLGAESFVSLTTFRKSGEAVATTVWVARDGDALIVTTTKDTGKVKRLRNNPLVELRPCGRFGSVKDGAVTVRAVAEIVPQTERHNQIMQQKYGVQFRMAMAIERRSTSPGRVILRLTEG